MFRPGRSCRGVRAGRVSDVSEGVAPAFNRGFRLRHDAVRDAWVILAPERLMLLDAPGVEVLRLVDGVRTVGEIVDVLAARFDAPRGVIATDVAAMLRDLVEKGAIRL